MESLSQALKPWMSGNGFDRKLEDRMKQVLAEPPVQKLLGAHPEIDDRTIKMHLNKLYQYGAEYKSCTNCPGLDQCPNDLTGHYTKLSVEDVGGNVYLHDHKVACKKWIAHGAEEAARKRIRSFYADDRSIAGGYDPEELLLIDKKRMKAANQVLNYIVSTKESGLSKRGLYLTGTLGTGKTYLMGYMLHELAKEGLTGIIVYMPDLVEDLKASFQEPQRLRDMIEAMKETDLLVLDDIGAENLTPWVRDHVLGAILNYRMNRKPTFYTSNYALGDLEKHFSFTNREGEEEFKGQRLMDRIRPFVDIVVVDGTNKRGAAG